MSVSQVVECCSGGTSPRLPGWCSKLTFSKRLLPTGLNGLGGLRDDLDLFKGLNVDLLLLPSNHFGPGKPIHW